jgi:hypothetical protein
MRKLIPFLVITIAALISCNNQTIPTGISANPTTESWRCGLIQEKVDYLDLSGEWRAEFNAFASDTLFINNNGFYIQQFAETTSGYKYESESNRWYLEEVSDGGIYIHLEGMLDCGSMEKCVNPINAELGFYDFCGDKWFTFDDGFILSVDGDSRISRGLSLRRMRPAGCEGCFEKYYFVKK